MGSYIEKQMTETTNFINNVRNMFDNTLNFENCSYREKYVNDDVQFMDKSEKNLIYFRNILQEKYLTRIINNRHKTSITIEQKNDFDMNPYLAAHTLLGNREYWWLILLVNKKINVESFTKLKDYIYTPDISDIKECLINEMSKNEDVGQIK